MKKTLIALFFLLLLFPPLFWLATGGRFAGENYEKRTLAALPTLTANTLADFPQAFEAYFSDHLPFRNLLVNAYSRLSVDVLHTSPNPHVILGRDGWLFYSPEDSDPIGYYLNRRRYTEITFENVLNNYLLPAKEELAARGVEFALMIVPNKERVYPEYMSAAYGPPAEYYSAEAFVRYIREHSDIRVVFPYEDMMALKPDMNVPLYLKTDTHWNMLGSYVGACALLRALNIDMPDVRSLDVQPGESFAGDLAAQLGLSESMQTDIFYRLADWPRKDAFIQNDKDGVAYVMRTADGGDTRRLLVRRDSFGEYMADYVGAQFADCLMIHTGAYTREMFDEYQPDIYVLETTERYLIDPIMFGVY